MDATYDTRSLRTRVEVMRKAKARYDAAILLDLTMVAGITPDDVELNPAGYDGACKLAAEVRDAAYTAWRVSRDSVRHWGAEANMIDARVQDALGLAYAESLSDGELAEVTCLVTEWRYASLRRR